MLLVTGTVINICTVLLNRTDTFSHTMSLSIYVGAGMGGNREHMIRGKEIELFHAILESYKKRVGFGKGNRLGLLDIPLNNFNWFK